MLQLAPTRMKGPGSLLRKQRLAPRNRQQHTREQVEITGPLEHYIIHNHQEEEYSD